jgi:hypothetical protein
VQLTLTFLEPRSPPPTPSLQLDAASRAAIVEILARIIAQADALIRHKEATNE